MNSALPLWLRGTTVHSSLCIAGRQPQKTPYCLESAPIASDLPLARDAEGVRIGARGWGLLRSATDGEIRRVYLSLD